MKLLVLVFLLSVNLAANAELSREDKEQFIFETVEFPSLKVNLDGVFEGFLQMRGITDPEQKSRAFAYREKQYISDLRKSLQLVSAKLYEIYTDDEIDALYEWISSPYGQSITEKNAQMLSRATLYVQGPMQNHIESMMNEFNTNPDAFLYYED